MRIKMAAEQHALDSAHSSLERERSAAEEQRQALADLLRQLEAREEKLVQVWSGVVQGLALLPV